MKRESHLLVRLSDDEKSAFEIAAELAGINMSAWARQKLRLAAAKELRDADRPVPFLKEVIAS
jgi:predicted HicB family RNase H-like nuclease